MSEESGAGEQGGKSPLRRTLDVCVFAPIGAAVTLAEELPDFVDKGRRRIGLQLGNARVVGRFVVHKGRHDLAGRIEDILNNGVAVARAAEEAERAEEAALAEEAERAEEAALAEEAERAEEAALAEAGTWADAHERAREAAHPVQAQGAALKPVASLSPPPRIAAPDPMAEATVRRSLSDYDTLSASQVVRRLESLGPEELRAVQRYEASHRNRRTILNRAGQLLDPAAPGSFTG